MKALKVFPANPTAIDTGSPHIDLVECDPGPLSEDFVRVAMRYAGICGTDRHLLMGAAQGSGSPASTVPLAIPEQGLIYGHEGVGQVFACGAHVTNLKVGDYVVFESLHYCGQCEVCARGDLNQCPQGSLFGTQMNGVFSQYADIPAKMAYAINDCVKSEENLQALACVEPAACALLACWNAAVCEADNVLVCGGGPIGLLCAMLCRLALGAKSVYLVEPFESRRELAREWADEVYSRVDQCDKALDVVIEASGHLQNIGSLFQQINPNGRVILLARNPGTLSISDVGHMITNAISVMGSRGHLGGAFDAILRLYKDGRLPLGKIISCIEEFDRLPYLLTVKGFEDRYCKVLIDFDG